MSRKGKTWAFTLLMIFTLALAACAPAVLPLPDAGGNANANRPAEAEDSAPAGQAGTETGPETQTGEDDEAGEASQTEQTPGPGQGTEHPLAPGETEDPEPTIAGLGEDPETGAPGPGDAAPAATPQPDLHDTGQGERSAAELPPARLTALSDLSLWSTEGFRLGAVSDQILDLGTARVSYLFVSPDPALGLAEGSRLAIPWEAVNISASAEATQETTLVVEIDPAQARLAPVLTPQEIDQIRSLSLEGRDWDADLRRFWEDEMGVTFTPREQRAMIDLQLPASEALALQINDPQGNLIGRVSDFIFDPNTGQVDYVVLRGGEGLGNRTIPIPLSVLAMDGQGANLAFPLDPSALNLAPGIDLNRLGESLLSTAADLGWEDEILEFWLNFNLQQNQ